MVTIGESKCVPVKPDGGAADRSVTTFGEFRRSSRKEKKSKSPKGASTAAKGSGGGKTPSVVPTKVDAGRVLPDKIKSI